MSYQVLARKWRPQNFKEMVGQEHVLRALINALDNDRLHHAYLFTGTRGVGKTTIARILAKCLNCETGITSEPCCSCSSCQEIVTGNFVDLIEVDAASRTKVEDTRELLDNVQYAPTRGRFKVYLIDEVHMLTGHSFNALLKTLEEPPPHVKFLFATTDPQKLPVTILSRCLQFNLKRMPVDMISGHLNTILKAEEIPFDEPSLRLIARGADGSMRDALSLLDQSIAFGDNELKEDDVREMLGSISHEPLLNLLKAVSAGDGSAILNQIEDLSGVTPDFEAATDAMIALLHELAVQQLVPKAQQDDENVTKLAQQLSKEDVQLYYQIALQGRRDLPLSPDPRSGFEMILLRMLSFRPLREGMKLESASSENSGSETTAGTTDKLIEESAKKKTVTNDGLVAEVHVKPPVKSHVQSFDQTTAENHQQSTVSSEAAFLESYTPEIKKPAAQSDIVKNQEPPPWDDIPPELESKAVKPLVSNESRSVAVDEVKPTNQSQKNVDDLDNTVRQNNQTLGWHEVVTKLKLGGRAAELIKHCLLASQEDGIISLTLDKGSEGLLADSVQSEIESAMTDFYGKSVKLKIIVETSTNTPPINGVALENETPAQRSHRLVNEKQQQAEKNIATDPFVLELQNRFGAQIVPGSVQPK